jgi:hypothetical protein
MGTAPDIYISWALGVSSHMPCLAAWTVELVRAVGLTAAPMRLGCSCLTTATVRPGRHAATSSRRGKRLGVFASPTCCPRPLSEGTQRDEPAQVGGGPPQTHPAALRSGMRMGFETPEQRRPLRTPTRAEEGTSFCAGGGAGAGGASARECRDPTRRRAQRRGLR